jgi:hypothetical protein
MFWNGEPQNHTNYVVPSHDLSASKMFTYVGDWTGNINVSPKNAFHQSPACFLKILCTLVLGEKNRFLNSNFFYPLWILTYTKIEVLRLKASTIQNLYCLTFLTKTLKSFGLAFRSGVKSVSRLCFLVRKCLCPSISEKCI